MGFFMPMTFKCPSCGRDLEAPDGAAGQRGVCRFCGARIVAPNAPAQPAQLDMPPPAPPPTAPSPSATPDPNAWRPSSASAAPNPNAWRAASAASPFAAVAALPVADFWQRVLGFVVDMIGQWLVYFLLHPILSLVNPWPTGNLTDILAGLQSGTANPQEVAAQLNLTKLLLGQVYWLIWVGVIQWLYFALFESSALQATPGKLLAGTKVTDMQGRRISFGRATTRAFAKGLSAMLCYIGYVMAAFNTQCQALHDMIAQTLVLKR